jgi:hypothetical protein
MSGAGYVLGEVSAGNLAIIDEKQRFNIQAIQSLAAVDGDNALLLITRQGPMNNSTTLHLDIDGTGVKGVDYLALPTYVSFSAYQTDHVLPVIALADGALADTDISRTVTVALKPTFSNSYKLGNSSNALVRLLSNQEAFESWVVANNEAASPTMSDEELAKISSARTGLEALLEYAFSYGVEFEDGLSSQEQAQFTPQITIIDGSLQVEYTKRLNDERLEYVLQHSSDMVEWNSGAEDFEALPVTEAEENAGRVRYRVIDTGAKNCFIRVSVNLND